jgi:hypothetical protein
VFCVPIVRKLMNTIKFKMRRLRGKPTIYYI